MVYLGIYIDIGKHDCLITNPDGEVLFYFTISNNREDYETLFQRIDPLLNKIHEYCRGWRF